MSLAEAKLDELTPDDYTLRNQIIMEYIPQVKRIVNRIANHLPPSVEVDDLMNAGIIGLIQAIERYDSSRDNKFLTYAIFRIKGAVLSELRSRDFLGRSVRKKLREIEKTYLKLEQRSGSEVEDEEVAGELGLDIEQFHKIKKMSSISFISFDEIGYYSKEDKESVMKYFIDEETDDALTLTKIKEIQDVLGRCIEKLPEKLKQVVSLYYVDELTMKEIGKVLEITESRVSQIHSQAVFLLRKKLRKEGFIEDWQIGDPEKVNCSKIASSASE